MVVVVGCGFMVVEGCGLMVVAAVEYVRERERERERESEMNKKWIEMKNMRCDVEWVVK